MQRIKQFIRGFLYNTGLLTAYHRMINGSTLTVVLFHRVLPQSHKLWSYADQNWTVSTDFFKQCIQFFKKHYHVVSIEDIHQAFRGTRPLPKRALLITFDDGWLDNLQYADPILKEENVRALMFVTTGALGRKILNWQEALFDSYQRGLFDSSWIECLENKSKVKLNQVNNFNDVYQMISKLQTCSEEIINNVRVEILDLYNKLIEERQMLNFDELKNLSQFDIGTHGLEHEPLTKRKNANFESLEARNLLAAFLNNGTIKSLSFPHGRLSDQLIMFLWSNHYDYLFCGERTINVFNEKQQKILLGRYNIEQSMYSKNNKLICDSLAKDLFIQPRINLSSRYRMP